MGQKSYQIIVARPDTDFAPAWESGVVESSATNGIVCNATLQPNAQCEAGLLAIHSVGAGGGGGAGS